MRSARRRPSPRSGTCACSRPTWTPPTQSPLAGRGLRLDLDEAWLRTEFAVLSGEHKYKFSSYRRFDTTSSQWVNVIVDNLGGHAMSWSKDGVTWMGESSGPMGGMKIRDTETIVSSDEVKMRGQYSLDGRGWSSGYDLSCKK